MGFPTAYLLKSRRFLPLFLTQFFGAFNDNAFKLAMLTLISYHVSTSSMQSEKYQAIAGALFTIPFFLFSATAGQLADKFDKARLAIAVKILEVILMIIGSFALYLQNVFLMMLTLTGMGIHSTFFGPIKYAILPNHLFRKELLGGTSLIEASTFLAILFGTTLGALTIGSTSPHPGYAVALTNLVAWLGLASSIFIPKALPKVSELKIDWNVGRATIQMMKAAMTNHKVLPAIFTISWFWLLGTVILTKLPDYTHYVLKAQPTVFAFFLALFSIGIALGAISIGHLLAGKITLRYVPPCMLLLSFFGIDLYLASPKALTVDSLQSLIVFLSQLNSLRITADFFLFSVSAGLFIVPLYTYLQVVSDETLRARTIATNNIFNALFMIIGSAFVMFLIYLNMSIPMVFLILAILNALTAVGLWWPLTKIGTL
ncbi:2-acylglycerophosphoethanolamine acyltransferase [Legionella lansingensis]|uniref:2-acylglycerophosphoethanolamine acyltransferase n=1 Tax=Legionella lansingensis TaxID=45067 RepID=A0A0W0VT97_9GAMM|nr:MFS transporter [Legionella lansingensis]KTD23363.1 2-acylglycerophosphoethanolamine acyltransferase [Legionella lansingensis]SNV49398.1 2-acylglycerophosphoethanolamine acyltransferase [Legionella lansingensis]